MTPTQVVAAARALGFLAKLKPRVKCLTVHGDGCKDFKDNPETQPVRKSKVGPPPQPGEVRAGVGVGNGVGVRNGASSTRCRKEDPHLSYARGTPVSPRRMVSPSSF